MPIAYERDNQRRLITVTVTEPYSVGDILSVIDRQAAEDTWQYAMLYDLRAMTQPSNEADSQQIVDRLRVVGGGRERGPVGLAIRAQPALFRAGLMHTKLTRELASIELLLNESQLADWLARNTRGGSSRQP